MRGHSHRARTISAQWTYPERMPPSVAMALVEQAPNGFAGGQLYGMLAGKLDHSRDGRLVRPPLVEHARQGGGEHFVHGFKLAAGKLLLDHPLMFWLQHDGHTSKITRKAGGPQCPRGAVCRII